MGWLRDGFHCTAFSPLPVEQKKSVAPEHSSVLAGSEIATEVNSAPHAFERPLHGKFPCTLPACLGQQICK